MVRDGRLNDIDAEELVVDDLVVIGPGDRTSADMTVERNHGLAIDTSTLTGESVPVGVEEVEVLHVGTFVVEGEGRATVMATGLRADSTR